MSDIDDVGPDDEVAGDYLTPEERALLAKLQGMGNEDLAKHILKAALIRLAMSIESGLATAADLNVARQFLKDNNVGIVPTRGNAAHRVQEAIQRRAGEVGAKVDTIPLDQIDSFDISDFVGRGH